MAVEEFWIPKSNFRSKFDIAGALKDQERDKKVGLPVDTFESFQG